MTETVELDEWTIATLDIIAERTGKDVSEIVQCFLDGETVQCTKPQVSLSAS